MRHMILCTICNVRDRCVEFLPSGHFLTCEVCGQEANTRPTCGMAVESRVVVNQ
ncbi:hypothetical protein DPMN_050212 [Dreissena polymorpha]|uniref:Uncharacterized protein n=1 Tax=Dreissena polymorpha TaxID=45954 RepID=A0A9D4CFP6_DREPO|nr:hypothetical protein DPMN_050212 [Dreissena polymorpha]